MPRPIQDLPTVEPKPSVRAYQQIEGADAGAFGGIAAAATAHAGNTAFEATVSSAKFDSYTETQTAANSFLYGLGSVRDTLAAALRAAPDEEAIKKAQAAYVEDVGKLRASVSGSLTSELSKRNFAIHADPHVAQANRIAGLEADAAKRSLLTRNVNAAFVGAVQLAGAVTATDQDVKPDKDGFPTSERVTADAKAWQENLAKPLEAIRVDMAYNGKTPEEINNRVQQLEVAAAKQALDGYALQPKAGLAFLNAVLPDGRRMFDREHPKESVLTAGDADPLIKHLMGNKTAKTATGLAGEWALNGLPTGTLDGALRESVARGDITYAESGEVAKAYYQRQAERHADEKRGIDSQSNSFFELVSSKYGGDLDRAKRDPAFLTQWNSTGTSELAKLDAQEKLARLNKEDPSTTQKLLAFFEKTATPGWSLTQNKEAWASEINGLGPYRATALAAYQKDQTDREKETYPGERAALRGELDAKVSSIVDFNRFANPTWVSADPVQATVWGRAQLLLFQKLSVINSNAAKDPKINVQEQQRQALYDVVQAAKIDYDRLKKDPNARLATGASDPKVRPTPPPPAQLAPDQEMSGANFKGGDPNWIYKQRPTKHADGTTSYDWVPIRKVN